MFMRKYARKDKNHGLITSELVQLGCSVVDMSSLGGGVADILVGFGGVNFIFEIKSTDHKWLTKDEEEWHNSWLGTVYTVNSIDQIKRLIRRDLLKYDLMDAHNQFMRKVNGQSDSD